MDYDQDYYNAMSTEEQMWLDYDSDINCPDEPQFTGEATAANSGECLLDTEDFS